MCFDSVVTFAPTQEPRDVRFGRCFALLLALLIVSLPLRALAVTAGPLASPGSRLLAKRSQALQLNAVRAEVVVRVAPAPVLDRPPCLPAHLAVRPWRSARLAPPRARGSQLRQAVSHFHSKRRIPRMNTDEPPRA
ncbi:MAG TPA: hypothetical protein VGL19_08850 [Polyangiaceae bacterium]